MSPGKNKGDKGKEKRKKPPCILEQTFSTFVPPFFCFSSCGSMANKVENPSWKVLEVNSS